MALRVSADGASTGIGISSMSRWRTPGEGPPLMRRPSADAVAGNGPDGPAPTQWRQGRYASCAHTVAPERRSWTSCTMCVYVIFILALIGARVNGRPKTLEHS